MEIAAPIQVYMREVRKIPLLSKAKEVELGKKIIRSDMSTEEVTGMCVTTSEAAKIQFQLANLRLVAFIAHKVRRKYPWLDLNDLVSKGNDGLEKATDKFDYRRGYKFSTCASWWIRAAILCDIQNQDRIIPLKQSRWEQISHFKKTERRLTHKLGRPPETAEIAEALKISEKKVHFLRTIARNVLSLEKPLNDNKSCLMDSLTKKAMEPADEVLQKISGEDFWQIVENDGQLTERQISVLHRHATDMTFEEIGKENGVTRQRINDIEKRAFKKLRQNDEIKDLYEATFGQVPPEVEEVKETVKTVAITSLSQTTSMNRGVNERELG